jgi:DeoR family glycerol-3-phosphate regulon repressor
MLRPDRQSAILKSLNDRALDGSGVCRVVDLALSLGVSGETVRRDIKLMARDGLVRKVHGGVALLDQAREPAFRQRLRENAQAKKAIADHAAREVHDGDSIMLDTGSTTAYVAEALLGHRDLTVVTNSVDIANTLATRNGNRVFMAGGELRADDGAVLGGGAVAFIKQFRAHIAFLSVGAIDIEDGLMDYHMSEAEFSRMIIERAERIIVVADRSKLGVRALVRIAGFDAIDSLITDVEPFPALAKRLLRDEVQVIVAGTQA